MVSLREEQIDYLLCCEVAMVLHLLGQYSVLGRDAVGGKCVFVGLVG